MQVTTNTNTDDTHVWQSSGTWTAGLYDTDLYIGRITSSSIKHGMGLRFRNATIPTDAGISNAYLQLCAGFDYSATTFHARIVGDKELSPATFSTIANYQSRRGTSAGGANDNLRTTASGPPCQPSFLIIGKNGKVYKIRVCCFIGFALCYHKGDGQFEKY